MISFAHYPITPLLAIAGMALDAVLGEPRRWHALVGFGKLAHWVEKRLNTEPFAKLKGVFGAVFLLTSFTLPAFYLCRISPIFDVLLLYFAIGHNSLHQHAHAVLQALQKGDEAQAKTAASYMVSRDPATIEPVPATVESVLENGNDGVFGALFWFFVAGGAGALLFRLANTLDAMWGYKNTRFLHFGWAAARLDDVLNIVPARLTALTYAMLGKFSQALRCWREQAPTWDSPNAGPVMSAGAGALGIRLGGSARYHGEWHQRPPLGIGEAPRAADIERALALVRRGVYLWLGLALLAGWLHA